MSDIRDAHSKGYLSRVPHFNSICNYLENPELTPILYSLISETSLPLKSVEVDFAADSSGFTTSRFVRWFDHKYGTVRQQHEWVKVHLMCGVRTPFRRAVEASLEGIAFAAAEPLREAPVGAGAGQCETRHRIWREAIIEAAPQASGRV
jgi:hypothetical protein